MNGLLYEIADYNSVISRFDTQACSPRTQILEERSCRPGQPRLHSEEFQAYLHFRQYCLKQCRFIFKIKILLSTQAEALFFLLRFPVQPGNENLCLVLFHLPVSCLADIFWRPALFCREMEGDWIWGRRQGSLEEWREGKMWLGCIV